MTQVTQIEIKQSIPAVIDFNFLELKQSLDGYLTKYENYTVTQSTLADDKKVAQELGKQARAISRARIDKKKELSEPISEFEEKMRELEGMIKTVQDQIGDQVKSFEAERLSAIKEALESFRREEIERVEVATEFSKSEISDLVMLSAFTATGNLTAKAKSEVTARVMTDKQTQQKAEIRLAQLEAESYKLGLAAPLQEAHVKHFLLENDEVYSEKLEAIIKAELEREKIAAERALAQAQREAELEAQKEAQAEQQGQQPQAHPEPVAEVKQEQPVQPAASGKKTVSLACYFTVEVKETLTNDHLIKALGKRMQEAGFSSVTKIEVL